ncbi:MAG: hypothetical protein DME75_01735 [Verrucomicrobia bacterium]|nr:MAG: hypothetical protein DME75_01735 [Verrucomicrobiota bacterium]
MPLLKQLELVFEKLVVAGIVDPGSQRAKRYNLQAGINDPGYSHVDHDADLEEMARDLLCATGASKPADLIRVEWNSRLKTAAGRADYRQKLISLNPRLFQHAAEIDRTLRHELAHILAQFRAGRRRILPHGPEWRQACRDLGISDEKRCHNKCPNCKRDFPRVRRIKRAVACLACCCAHNGGEFDARFRLQRVR